MEDTPIYCPTLSPEFYPDESSAAEAAWDDGLDPTTVEAYICRVYKAPVPYLQDIVEECWAAEFSDPDAMDCCVSKEVADELDRIYKRLVKEAPTVWMPTKTPVRLPAIQCPSCDYWSDEAYLEEYPTCNYCGRPNEHD